MEGIRGFAVFLVFIVHYVTTSIPWIATQNVYQHAVMNGLHRIGNTGVDHFFVLSGYLIDGTLIARKQSFFPFMARRIKRIYPTFGIVFFAYILLSYAFPLENKIPRAEPLVYLLENFLLLPGLFDIEPLITVAWSLSYEMFYYLTMPLTVNVFGLRERSIKWRIIFISSAAILTASYCATRGGPIRLIMFVVEMILYEAIQSEQVRAPSGVVAFIALVSGLLASLLPLNGNIKIGLLFASFMIFCLHVFLRPTDRLATVLSRTQIRWFGNMSYSYYLLHGLVLKAAFLLLGSIEEVQNYATQWLWNYNHERPNMALGGFIPKQRLAMAA